MLHKNHVISRYIIVRYYPWFHVTAVVLGTYYPADTGVHLYMPFLTSLFTIQVIESTVTYRLTG